MGVIQVSISYYKPRRTYFVFIFYINKFQLIKKQKKTIMSSTTAAATPTQPSPAAPTTADLDAYFHDNIEGVLKQIVAKYPTNQSAQQLLNLIPMANLDPRLKATFRAEWRDFTKDSRTQIMNNDTEHVKNMFANAPFPQAQALGIQHIISDPNLDEQSRIGIWEYIKLLTVLSHKGTPTEINAVPATPPAPIDPVIRPPATPFGNAVTSSPVPKPPAKANKPDMEKAMKTLIDSMPKMVDTFNKLMKDDDGSNVFAQMAKQFTNPGALQTGVPNNLAMNLMAEQQGSSSVMEQVQQQLGGTDELNADDIVAKLKKLERIEALRAKKKGLRR